MHPWLDRDLSIAGRVSGVKKDGTLFHQLVNIEKAIAVIPNLAIHLDRKANDNKSINAQNHLPIIIGQNNDKSFKEILLDYCLEDAESILDYELSCYDTQAPSFLGIEDEFICAARLDNLLSSYIGARALIKANSKNASLFVATDHEEVGSASMCGAQGPFLKSVLQRLTSSPSEFTQLINRSTLISCDNAHGIHPNLSLIHI